MIVCIAATIVSLVIICRPCKREQGNYIITRGNTDTSRNTCSCQTFLIFCSISKIVCAAFTTLVIADWLSLIAWSIFPFRIVAAGLAISDVHIWDVNTMPQTNRWCKHRWICDSLNCVIADDHWCIVGLLPMYYDTVRTSFSCRPTKIYCAPNSHFWNIVMHIYYWIASLWRRNPSLILLSCNFKHSRTLNHSEAFLHSPLL